MDDESLNFELEKCRFLNNNKISKMPKVNFYVSIFTHVCTFNFIKWHSLWYPDFRLIKTAQNMHIAHE